jgi:hypothetical protein
VGPNPTEPASLVYRFIGLHIIVIIMSTATDLSVTSVLSPYSKFKMALKSKEVKRQYPNLLEKFLDFCKIEGHSVEQKATNFYLFAKSKSQEELEDLVIKFILFQTERIDQGEITSGTLRNYLKALKLFCKMNRIGVFWDIISHSIPRVKKHANDRIPTVEEIKKLIEYPDRRIKPIVLLSVSTGVRVGAWDYMKWKHITPLKNENGDIIAAKLLVYPNEPEEYFTFMTSEAYNAVKEWMDFRASFGEEITGESWILRNTWQKVKPRYSHRIGLAKYPKQFKSTGIKTLVGRALQIQGVRSKLDLKNGEKNHDWKTLHGFRKFFKTQTERVMKSLNVEILMGHDIGISKPYYKPSEQEPFEDYKKAIDLLTIDSSKSRLEKQIKEIKEKSKDNDNLIKSKLEEKENQIQTLMKKQEQFQQLIQSLIDSGQLKPNNI